MADQRRSALTRRVLPAHPFFRRLLTELLARRLGEWRAQGNNAAAETLARITASTDLARLVSELERGKPGYMRPTVAALFWNDLGFRRKLQKHSRHAKALAACRWAARNETAARAQCAASILCWLAEAATKPDAKTQCEIDEHQRIFEEERTAYQLLWAKGLVDQAASHLTLAVKHLVIANNLQAPVAPDPDELVRLTYRKLAQQFGCAGYRTAAGLVSAALKKSISARHTRHSFKKFRR